MLNEEGIQVDEYIVIDLIIKLIKQNLMINNFIIVNDLPKELILLYNGNELMQSSKNLIYY